jgi:hypothetical protein
VQINQKVTIDVAEPWDFTSSEGDNIFSGIISDYATSSTGEVYLIKNNKSFFLNGKKVNYVVATYRNKKINDKALNLAYIPDEAITDFKNFDTIKDKLEFIIIGSIK